MINSGVLGYVSGITNNPPRNAHAMLFGSNKAARMCDEYSTNLNGIKVSTSLTGKITSIQFKSDLNSRPNTHQVSTLLGNALTNQESIAVVFPTFTAAAYDNAFYDFYSKHIDTPPGKNVTRDLDLLSTKVRNQISPIASGYAMLFLIRNLEA